VSGRRVACLLVASSLRTLHLVLSLMFVNRQAVIVLDNDRWIDWQTATAHSRTGSPRYGVDDDDAFALHAHLDVR
jgi:hypothetical protein